MDMQNITKITLAWELYEVGVLKQNIAARLDVNRDTIRLWIQGIQSYGILSFLDRPTPAPWLASGRSGGPSNAPSLWLLLAPPAGRAAIRNAAATRLLPRREDCRTTLPPLMSRL